MKEVPCRCFYVLQVARKVNDPNLPRPWSRYSAKKADLNNNEKKMVEEKSHSLQKGHKPAKDEATTSKGIENNDHQLQEFLQVMQPRSKSKLWADDTISAIDKDDKVNMEEACYSASKKKQSNKENEFSNKASSSPALEGCPEINPIDQSNDTACDDDITDMDYFKSRIKKNWSDSETDDEGSDDEGTGSIKSHMAVLEAKDQTAEMGEAQIDGEINHDETKEKPSSKGSDAEEDENKNLTTLTSDDKKDIDTGRLFIRNLPFTAKYENIYSLETSMQCICSLILKSNVAGQYSF